MALTVAVMSLAAERLWAVLPHSPYFDSLESLGVTFVLMLFGGTIAFFMVWTEFTVISETSALTFMVAGTFKEIVTGAFQGFSGFIGACPCCPLALHSAGAPQPPWFGVCLFACQICTPPVEAQHVKWAPCAVSPSV